MGRADARSGGSRSYSSSGEHSSSLSSVGHRVNSSSSRADSGSSYRGGISYRPNPSGGYSMRPPLTPYIPYGVHLYRHNRESCIGSVIGWVLAKLKQEVGSG